jgi:hypothetical protein
MTSLAPDAGIVSASPPIFVVGSPRSGTSLFRLILDSHPSIACGPETHLLARMDDAAKRYAKQLDRYAFDDAYWHAQYRTFFESFKLDYAHRKGKARWADKTPSYARHLPFITSVFPEAQVVHVIRDVHMVTASALNRWGWRRAWDTPDRWVANVNAARTFGAEMSPAQYTEIRFEDLVGDTEGTLRPLFEWFGEAWDPCVLDYDQHEHDESPRNRRVRETARSAGGTAVDQTRATKPRRKVDPVLRAHIRQVAGALNRELGYR